MFASDDDKDKRELMQDFLHFLLDGAASRVPGAEAPSLAALIAHRVGHETQQKLETLLPQYLDRELPRLLDEALQRQAYIGGTPSMGPLVNRGTLIATAAALIFAGLAAVFATLYFMEPAQPTANPYANDQDVGEQTTSAPPAASAIDQP